MPRIPSTSYQLLLRVTTVVLCIAGLCGVALCLIRLMAPYYEVLVSYWNLQKTYRLWLTWWEFPSRSILRKNQGWSSHSWEVQWLGELGLLGDEWVSNEGWTSLVFGLSLSLQNCCG